jgi:hypothetical protein
MAIHEELREKIRQISAELRFDLFGPKGYPAWGTTFEEIEDATGEVGDALACEMLSQGLQVQAEKEGYQEGKCHCGEPIPFEEVAGRLLQAKRGEAQWRETYGQCKRCRKDFLPAVESFGHRAG